MSIRQTMAGVCASTANANVPDAANQLAFRFTFLYLCFGDAVLSRILKSKSI